MELAVASQWAEIIGLITILSAAIYSWFQIKELKKVRQSAAALSLAELFTPGKTLAELTPQERETVNTLVKLTFGKKD